MSFSDHKITAFTHRIADLPDQPNLPADELKARFDSSPEELRTAHNAVCDDADRLEARVEGIIAQTFGDTIDKSMLSTELAAELDAKATKTELNSEIDTLEQTDDAFDARLDMIETALPLKCEVQVGTYTGTGADNRFINLGRTPAAVLLCDEDSNMRDGSYTFGGIAMQGLPTLGLSVTTNGFTVRENENIRCNHISNGYGRVYHYVALFAE